MLLNNAIHLGQGKQIKYLIIVDLDGICGTSL